MSNSEDRYHTLPKASGEASAAAAAARQRLRDQLLIEQRPISASSRTLRTSSPRWREHYAMVSSRWGAIASGTVSPTMWEDIQEQKAKGGYPWTHLSHDQDAEVWINPVKLPTDITTVTMRRKDRSIPREWFHLPKGADPPTIEDLLRDSSPEPLENEERAKSPPICGRSRSKSKERKLNKNHDKIRESSRYVDDGGYEPVGAANRAPMPIKPLNKMSPGVLKKSDRAGNEQVAKSNAPRIEALPPRKAFTALPEPPKVNRDTKPDIQPTKPPAKNVEDGGYEPVGRKVYEDVELPRKDDPPPYAKVNLEAKAQKGKNEAADPKEQREKEKREKAEREAKEKEKKIKEKAEKERKEKEDRERKLKEKEEKEKREKEEKERKHREKLEKEREEKERKLREKQEKEKREKEAKEKAVREKLEKVREQQEKKEKQAREKEREEKEAKEKEAREKVVKEKEAREREAKEREAKEKEAKEKEAREKVVKEKEAKEREAKEKEAKEKEARENMLNEKEAKERKAKEKEEREKVAKEKEALENEAKEPRAPTNMASELKNVVAYDGEASVTAVIGEFSRSEHYVVDQADYPFDEEQEILFDEQQLADEDDYMDETDLAAIGGTDDSPFRGPMINSDGKPMTEKEVKKMMKAQEKDRKKREKELKAQQQKEEKERRKKEKEAKQQEKKDIEMRERLEKEEKAKAEKLRKKEEKLRKQQEEKEKKNKGKSLAELASQKSTEKLKALGQILVEEDKQFREEEAKEAPIRKAENEISENAKERYQQEQDFQADDFERFLNGEQSYKQLPQYESTFEGEEPIDYHKALQQPDWPVYQKELESSRGRSRKDQEKKKRELPKLQMPKVDVKSKLTTVNESIKNARLPRPNEIKDGYLNSNFHKSFHQPLAVRTRVEEVDVQQQREMMTKRKTPAELGQLNHPLDIPLPKWRLPPKKGEKDTQSLNPEDLATNQSRLYGTLPKSWRQQNLVTGGKLMEDREEAEKRQALVKAKTPAQLAEFNSILDFPIPSKVKAIVSPSERKILAQKQKRLSASTGRVDKSAPSLEDTRAKPSWKETKLVTNVREDLDFDEAQRRMKLTQTKSPSELAQFHSFADMPVPSKISKMFKQTPKSKSKSEADIKKSCTAEATPTPPANAWRDQKFITNVKVEEDKAELERRRALTSTKSPAELSQITSLQDLPVPTTLRRIMKSSAGTKKAAVISESPSRGEKPAMSKIFSRSWSNLASPAEKSRTLLVVAKKVEDPTVQAARAETVKTKTVAELSHIGSLADIPIPSSIQQLTLKRNKKKCENDEEQQSKKMQDFIPDSLKTELLVATKTDKQGTEELKARQELVRSKTPTELSKFNSLADIPIPKVFKSREASASRPVSPNPDVTTRAGFYDSLPRSLKTEVLVRSRLEDPDTQRERCATVKAKSVNELSQINSFEDFPLPKPLENLVGRTGSRPVERKKRFREKQRSMSTKSLQEKLVPDSLRSQQLLVVSKFEDPDILRSRREITQSRSVSELSQISRLSDIPIPTTLERFGRRLKKSRSGDDVPQIKDYSHLSPMAIHDSIYSTLPRSLKSEVLVRARVEKPDVVKARKELVQSKSVGELSQMKSLSDVPIPSPLQNLLQGKKAKSHGIGDESCNEDNDSSSVFSGATGFSSRIGHYDIYASLPSSLKRGVLVRSKTDDPYETLVKRRALAESKSPAELSQISQLSDFPIPSRIEDWMHKEASRRDTGIRSISPRAALPEALTKQCLVRCKTENPQVLQERQQAILHNSPHELSKIRNLNEVPLPVKRLQLPDFPLPSPKYMFKPPKRVKKVDEACQTTESSFEGFTPVSTPRLLEATLSDDDALRFEMSSPESTNLPRDADFGYEVIQKENEEDADDDESSASVADHYKGTPPLKGKKKRHNHRAEGHGSELAKKNGEMPPPIPPKKAQKMREREASVETTTSFHSMATDDERIQSRPLPTPPTPARSHRKVEEEEFHSFRSSCTLVGTAKEDHDQGEETLADSLIESMHTCMDTLNQDDVTLQSNGETLENPSDDEDEYLAEMLPHDSKDDRREDGGTKTPTL